METRLTFIEETIDLGDIKKNTSVDFCFVGNLETDSPQLFNVRGTCGCTDISTGFTQGSGKVEIKGTLRGRSQLGKGKKKIIISKPVEKDLYFIYNVIK